MSRTFDIQDESVQAPRKLSGTFFTLINGAGAILSVSLLAALGWWLWTVSTVDPNDIPVIQAMDGPARVAPDDPGGTQAAYQGLAVNQVQSNGSAAPPADRVTLAPENVGLSAQDVSPVPRPEKTLRADSIATAIQNDAAEQSSGVVSTSPQAPARSLRPIGRPGNLKVILASAPSSTPQDGSAIGIVPGMRLIQLGAFESEDLAMKHWAGLMQKNSDLLRDRSRAVQVVENNGRLFYRLRASGFETLDDAKFLCTAMLARGVPCIPVTAR